MKLHPLKFHPIFKHRIWGGEKLKTILGKSLPANQIGESWELSAVPGDISVVDGGSFDGRTLNDLIEEFPEAILGSEVVRRFGATMPLLFKFIDASEDLSIQVHPNDKVALERHGSPGKTEMWYIMDAEPGSRLIAGFADNHSKESYLAALKSGQLTSILKSESVAKGDIFFLETGTVHAIGAGILLAEIQQTSDVTYRIYDWDRVDDQGNARALHTAEALDVISFDTTDTRVAYTKELNTANATVACPYFTTSFIPLDGNLTLYSPGSSFTVLMCVEGSFEIIANDSTLFVRKGETILVPAAIAEFSLKGTAELLHVQIT